MVQLKHLQPVLKCTLHSRVHILPITGHLVAKVNELVLKIYNRMPAIVLDIDGVILKGRSAIGNSA